MAQTLSPALGKSEDLSIDQMKALWRGELDHPYGEGAVITTLATVLRLLPGNAHIPPEELIAQARARWGQRDRERFN